MESGGCGGGGSKRPYNLWIKKSFLEERICVVCMAIRPNLIGRGTCSPKKVKHELTKLIYADEFPKTEQK